MQTQTSLYIPKPCHEDWNKMTPTQQGKFCSACSKQVIDFSLMSDQQILNFLSHQSGKLCGRFDADQLQRPLSEPKLNKKKSWWMALTMPLLFLLERSEAQKNTLNKTDTITQVKERKDLIVGKLIYQPSNRITVTGKVVDENNYPMAFASVIQKGTINGTITDGLGNFSIEINSYQDSITLTASYVGFSSADKRIKLSDTNNIIIDLREQSIGLSEVVVVSQAITGRLGGAVAVCSRITSLEKIDTSFKKVLGISKIFPNPAPKGSTIHLDIKQAGEYQLQLLDNQSRLIMAEEINALEKSNAPIKIPSNIAAGIYYLRVINSASKKTYTEKMIIQ